jgi:hypothetical protein
VALHDLQELDDDLGTWPDEDLALAGLLGIVDGVERIVEHAGPHHGGRNEILDPRGGEGRYLRDRSRKSAIRSLERRECPEKGSEAHVAVRERIAAHARRIETRHGAIAPPRLS